MIRLIAAGLALLGLAAACGGNTEEAVPPATTVELNAPEPRQLPPPPARRSTRVVVNVVDGDTHRRVRGARVVIGVKADYSNPRGRAYLPIKRRAALPVRVSKPGYGTRVVRMPFAIRRRVTVRLFRADLQWTMYGANSRRTQAHAEINLRPPFKVVWSRGLGSLVEFPAVIADGVAYVANYKGHVYALDMRNGKVIWRFKPRRGKMASSPAVVGRDLVVHGMDGIVRVLDRRNGEQRWHFRVGSPIESSPVVRRWPRLLRCLERPRLRARPESAGSCAGATAPATRSPRAPRSRAGRSTSATTAAALHALAARTGKRRFVRSVNGRIYGTPAVAAGRVFVPSSTGNSLTAFSTSGRYLWRVGTGGYVYSSPAVWAGRVFFGSYSGRLYSVSAKSGRVLWSVGAGGPVSGAAVVVAGVAYAGSTWGRITGVDAKSGRVLLNFPHGEYVPVSGNGRRLLLHGYSRVWAVEPRQ